MGRRIDQNFIGTKGHSTERDRKISVRVGTSRYGQMEWIGQYNMARTNWLRPLRPEYIETAEWMDQVLPEREVTVRNEVRAGTSR